MLNTGYLNLCRDLQLPVQCLLDLILVMEAAALHLSGDFLHLLDVRQMGGLVILQGHHVALLTGDLLQLLAQVTGLLLLRPKEIHVDPEVLHQIVPEVFNLVWELVPSFIELLEAANEAVEDDLVVTDPVRGKAVLVSAGEADGVHVGQQLLT